MVTVSFSISDALFAAFREKFPLESHEEVLTHALIDLVQDDPYSPEAFAEDERRLKAIADGEFMTTDDVMSSLRGNIERRRV